MTIRRFWAAYERDLAMPLIRHLAMEFPDQLIAQYWLDHSRSAEPELTDQYLQPDFLVVLQSQARSTMRRRWLNT